jgi:hypothetical protein
MTVMKDNRCFICKYKQEDTEKVSEDLIYDAKGHSQALPLCYTHSVELYKTGQKNFLNKHRNIFIGNLGLENDLDLIEYFNVNRKERSWY